VNTTTCELCCNTGGAYKAIDEPGKWAHSICSSWISEIYTEEDNGETILTLKGLDRKRFKLRCVLCTGKGACIQCSYGKCCIPAHPWCVLHTPKGFTRRVIKDEDDQMVWDIFCKAHATAVSEPLKPKVKQKSNAASAPAAVMPLQIQESLEDKIRNRRGDRKGSKPKYSMSHCMRTTAPKGPGEGSKSSNAKDYGRNGSDDSRKKKKSRDSDEENDDSEEQDEEDDETSAKIVAYSKSLNTKKSGKTVTKRDLPSASIAPAQTFPLLTLVEWPGQAEGEAMDLDHFWNVASMHYPEDHSLQVRGAGLC
jgi:PHD-zinc-finger like domain